MIYIKKLWPELPRNSRTVNMKIQVHSIVRLYSGKEKLSNL